MNLRKLTLYSLITYVVTATMIAAGIWGYKIIWGKPTHINHFFERVLIETVWNDPETLTLAGMLDNTLLDFHSHKLTDASPAHTISSIERSKRQLSMLRRYNRDRLDGQKAISYDMLEWVLTSEIDREPWMFHDYPIDQLRGVQSTLPSFMDVNHNLVNKKSAENYIKRLKAFKPKFLQVRESIQHQAELGIIPPRFVIDHVLTEMTAFISDDPESNMLYTSFEKRLSEIHHISTDDMDALKQNAVTAIMDYVYPAYQILIDTMEDLKQDAPLDAGAWTLPNGDAWYEYLVRHHTTLSVTPDEVHRIGLREVERLQAQIIDRFDKIGIHGETINDRFRILDELPDMFYPDEEENYTLIIAEYTSLIDTLYRYSDPLFNRTPRADIEVRRVPEFSQETVPFAYYNIPALDGSRPGIFYINLMHLDRLPKYGMMTLTAHEAVPGHHFQIGLQQEIEGIPTLRNLLPITAYTEGWALYAEELMAEIGLYDDDPYSDIGRLQAEMFRAVRLVVDTGIHLKRWTRDESVEYIVEHTGFPRELVVSEVERYIVMPGQALSYKIGMMHIKDLRKQAESRLGDKFDIREFHDVILMNGSLPLEILTGVVDSYINETQ